MSVTTISIEESYIGKVIAKFGQLLNHRSRLSGGHRYLHTIFLS